jgi:hypothetical protein
MPTFSNNSAPELHEVLIIDANFNLLAVNQTNYNFYTWGYTPKNQLSNSYIVSSGLPYNSYVTFDTLNNYYWVEYGNDNQCQTRSYYNQPIPLGTSVESAAKIELFPNPFTDYIYIRGIIEDSELEIFTQLGVCILKTTVSPSNNFLNTSELHNGIFFVSVKTKNRKLLFKIIK